LDGFSQEIADKLGRKIKFMGGQLADSIIECTHYVVPSLKRTPNLCEALARGRSVVDPAWIEHSFRMVHFVGEFWKNKEWDGQKSCHTFFFSRKFFWRRISLLFLNCHVFA
jgi:hypothetical protein